VSAQPSEIRRNREWRAPLELVKRKGRRLVKKKRNTRSAPLIIVATILVGAVIFGVLLEQVVLAQSAFRLSQINEQLDAAESKHEELLLNAARLEAPGRIESYARTRLGMVDPAHVEYIVADVPRRHGRRFAAATSKLPATGQAAAQGSGLEDGAP
jgi:cell division protein FtsL